jgi:hypothetical protein
LDPDSSLPTPCTDSATAVVWFEYIEPKGLTVPMNSALSFLLPVLLSDPVFSFLPPAAGFLENPGLATAEMKNALSVPIPKTRLNEH